MTSEMEGNKVSLPFATQHPLHAQTSCVLCEHDFGVFVAVCMCLCQWYNTIVQYTYVCVLTCMFIYVCVMCK